MMTDRLPLISVIVPVYNHAAYVEACLDSIATQDYESVELIVIDDGSADASAARVEAWLKRHPERFVRVVFERQANTGLVQTLNRMVGLADGDYVTLLASDDMLLPGALQFRVSVLDSLPSALALFTDCTVIDVEGRTIQESMVKGHHGANIQILRSPCNLLASLLLRWCVSGPVLTVRREAFDEDQGVGLFDEDFYPEDVDFYLRLAQTKRLHFNPERTAAYRLHGVNSVSTQGQRIYEGTQSILRKHAPTFPPYERVLAWLCYHAAVPPNQWIWYKRNPVQIASRLVLEAIRAAHQVRLTFRGLSWRGAPLNQPL